MPKEVCQPRAGREPPRVGFERFAEPRVVAFQVQEVVALLDRLVHRRVNRQARIDGLGRLVREFEAQEAFGFYELVAGVACADPPQLHQGRHEIALGEQPFGEAPPLVEVCRDDAGKTHVVDLDFKWTRLDTEGPQPERRRRLQGLGGERDSPRVESVVIRFEGEAPVDHNDEARTPGDDVQHHGFRAHGPRAGYPGHHDAGFSVEHRVHPDFAVAGDQYVDER